MTVEEVVPHVLRRVPEFVPEGRPEALSGGHLNLLWRVPGQPAPVVVKHAPPYVAAVPDIPLDAGRIEFEARALEDLGEGGRLAGISAPGVRPPRLLHFDARRHTLIIEEIRDACDLATWLQRGRRGTGPARLLGQFMARLHRCTGGRSELAARYGNRAVQQTRHRVQYRAVADFLRLAGVDDPAATSRAVALGERLLQPGTCLIMGDLWPASVLVTESGEVRIIDWELCHYGNPAQDLGHLAAHLWMQAHQARTPAVGRKARTLLAAFFTAYRNGMGTRLPSGILEDCALHFGCEVLMRAVGPFRVGSPYQGLDPHALPVRQAVAVALAHLSAPAAVTTFCRLGAGGGSDG